MPSVVGATAVTAGATAAAAVSTKGSALYLTPSSSSSSSLSPTARGVDSQFRITSNQRVDLGGAKTKRGRISSSTSPLPSRLLDQRGNAERKDPRFLRPLSGQTKTLSRGVDGEERGWRKDSKSSVAGEVDTRGKSSTPAAPVKEIIGSGQGARMTTKSEGQRQKASKMRSRKVDNGGRRSLTGNEGADEVRGTKEISSSSIRGQTLPARIRDRGQPPLVRVEGPRRQRLPLSLTSKSLDPRPPDRVVRGVGRGVTTSGQQARSGDTSRKMENNKRPATAVTLDRVQDQSGRRRESRGSVKESPKKPLPDVKVPLESGTTGPNSEKREQVDNVPLWSTLPGPKTHESSSSERRQRSRSIRREARRRREQSAGPAFGGSDPAGIGKMPSDKQQRDEAAERRMTKYKEERRRQLASQIANRLSVASSSSDEDDQSVGGQSGGGVAGAASAIGTGATRHESYSKYRRRRRKEGTPTASSDRSSRSGSSSARSRKVSAAVRPPAATTTPTATATAADRESPEHIYQQIGCELSAAVAELSKPPTPPPASTMPTAKQRMLLQDVNGAMIPPVPTPRKSTANKSNGKHSPSHYSSSTPPPPPPLAPSGSSSPGAGGRSNRNSLRDSTSPTSCCSAPLPPSSSVKRTSALLNMSYSSEELLFQAASELQTIDGEPDGSKDPRASYELSSPEILKSLSRTLTPPVSPFHSARSSGGCGPDKTLSSSSSTVAPPSSAGVVSDSLERWPGRPKKHSPSSSTSSDGASSSSRRRSSDLVLSCIKQSGSNNNGSASPGSVTSPGSSSANKPPIFPSSCSDRSSSSGIKIALRKTSADGNSPCFLRKKDDQDTVPQFVKEFAGVVRRRSNANPSGGFNPNEPAPPRPPGADRPQSAIMLPTRKVSASSEGGLDYSSPSRASRRKSDFMARYEVLTSRANEALHLVESTTATPEQQAPLSPEPEDVEFDEEEVLKTCQNFLKDYDDSKRRKSLTESTLPPVPKPRELLRSNNLPEGSPFVQCSPRRVSQPNTVSVQGTVRNRSSSLTLLDKRSPEAGRQHQQAQEFVPKPILKKSTEDLDSLLEQQQQQLQQPLRPVPILKHKDSEPNLSTPHTGGILKKKSADESQSRPDHIRIRSPSPDAARRPILIRSRNNSTCDERNSSPEPPPSILKRRSSTEDLEPSDPASRGSPEPQGILKRKYSSANTSGSRTPDSGDGGSLGGKPTSILKKQGSLEDVERIKSILKKKQVSTDDELDQDGFSSERPRSILKSRKSEESLSPLSDPNEVGVLTAVTRRTTAAADLVEPRPILKNRDSREDLFGGRSRTLSPAHDDPEQGDPTPILRYRDHDSNNRLSSSSFYKVESSDFSYRTSDVNDEFRPRRLSRPELFSPPPPSVEAAKDSDVHARSSPRRTARASPQPICGEAVEVVTEADPSKLTLAERVRLFDSSNFLTSPMATCKQPPPRPNTGASVLSRRRRNQALLARFQTQPITVDEVQEASRNMRRSGKADVASLRNIFSSASAISRGAPVKISRTPNSDHDSSSFSPKSKPLVHKHDVPEGFNMSRNPLHSEDPTLSIVRRKGSTPRSREYTEFFTEKMREGSSNTANISSTANVSVHSSSVMMRKRSILKNDSFEVTASGTTASEQSSAAAAPHVVRLKGVLKKDSSYDETLRPILKNADDVTAEAAAAAAVPSSPSTASNSEEDLSLGDNAPFSDVVIDPIPDAFRAKDDDEDSDELEQRLRRESESVQSRKQSLKDRLQTVIEPSSVKISSDDPHLANKLEQIALEADAIKQRQQLEEREKKAKEASSEPRIHLNQTTVITSGNDPQRQPAASKKANKDLGAEEYYRIFKSSQRNKDEEVEKSTSSSAEAKKSVSSQEENERVVEAAEDDDEEEEDKDDADVGHESVESNEMDGTKVQGGIAERLAALQKSGEENWKKKVPPKVGLDNNIVIADILNSNVDDDSDVQLRPKKTLVDDNQRPVSIVERLSKLQTAQTSWQAKVGEKDVGKFTVAGKMRSAKALSEVALSPEPARPRRNQIATRHDEDGDNSEDLITRTPKPRTITVAAGTPRPASTSVLPRIDVSESSRFRSVVVPEQDDDLLNAFFTPLYLSSANGDTAEGLDLDIVTRPSVGGELLSVPKRATVVRKSKKRSRNPLKQLAARSDLQQEYTERLTGVADKEMRRINVEKIEKASKHSHLAVEALAGLASKEDFSSVQLRRGDSYRAKELVPYKENGPMLLQIKGRRTCQTRLVAPRADFINSGDAFVLVTRDDVYLWQGKFSNVIERSRSAEVAATIVQRKELGCKATAKLHILEEEKSFGSSKAERDFWKRLGADSIGSAKPAGSPEEDEEFEVAVNAFNLVWEVKVADGKESLVPLDLSWGVAPRYEALQPDRVLVIDFGGEAYVWSGKSAPFELRRAGANLVKQVWSEGFDYSDVGKAHPLLGTAELRGPRPAWGVAGKVSQHMETVLFREKFVDWPDDAKPLRLREEDEEAQQANAGTNLTSGEMEVSAFDGIAMAKWVVEEPNLLLEGSCLGRGTGYYDVQERRQYEIETLSLKCWYVNEYNVTQLDDWQAQFHSEDTFVFRWIYKVSLTGRDLKGRPSKHAAVGRERCAYFFWQGADSKVTGKGACALMTVELDEERGPQIRVSQGKEHAAFLNLFGGMMTVHRGRRGERRQENKRLYVIRGETENEACGVEVECSTESLRSAGCLLLAHADLGQLTLWQGASAPEHTRHLAKQYASKLAQRPPPEMGFRKRGCVKLVEELEGHESRETKEALGDGTYAVNAPAPSGSPRLFYMSSVSGRFHVTELLCPFRRVDVVNTMAFSQSDLYSVEQPALFLMDAASKLWLWQGWWPEGETMTGSGRVRWHAERRAAMKTAVDYREASYKDSPLPKAELVWAGWEPNEFTNLFPAWTHRQDVQERNADFANGNNILEETLAELSKSEYTWEELLQRPLPDGVDPTKLESYLSDKDFEEHLGVSRSDFMAAPKWKQIDIRKERGLF